MYPSILQQRDVAPTSETSWKSTSKFRNHWAQWVDGFRLFQIWQSLARSISSKEPPTKQNWGRNFPSRKQLKLMLPQASYPTAASIPMVIKVTWTAPVILGYRGRRTIPGPTDKLLILNGLQCHIIYDGWYLRYLDAGCFLKIWPEWHFHSVPEVPGSSRCSKDPNIAAPQVCYR